LKSIMMSTDCFIKKSLPDSEIHEDPLIYHYLKAKIPPPKCFLGEVHMASDSFSGPYASHVGLIAMKAKGMRRVI